MKRFLFAFGFLTVFLTAGLAFGATQAAPTPSVIPPVWQGILSGLIAGLGVAVTGYLARPKLPDNSLEPFNVYKFVATALIGVIVGGIAGYKHTDFFTLWGSLSNLGVVAIVGMLAGLLSKRFPWLNGLLDAFQHQNPTPPAPPKP